MVDTVLVTGAASGIGEATTTEFESAGWKVYAADISADDVSVGDERLALDVTDEERACEVVGRIVEEDGSIDCVVNNAGNPRAGAVEDVSVEDAREQFDVNVHGPHRLVRAALPYMREQGDGTVVNMSSILGRVTLPGVGTYCASKHALEALSDALRVEVADFGVDVVLVEPGGVRTGFEEDALAETEYEGVYGSLHEGMERYADVLMNGRAATTPERVAEVIREAAEDDNPDDRYMVGGSAYVLRLTNAVPTRVRDRIAGMLF